MISFDEMKKRIEKMGYYATDELLYDMYNALSLLSNSEIGFGQDIYAMCLEGPPGAGKTEFAKTYAKLADEIFNNVEYISYQCDPTTGKTELYEDINISAAIRGDADHVNIPGKLIEAINKVNEGKKVVLFIDEYDKSRPETDAFTLQFFQSGRLNSTQHGDLEIKEEYKGNLQVIVVKNDKRELSGPLSRRLRITRLDYMLPSRFHKIANRLLIEENKNPVDEGIINLISLMYEKAYENRELYDRLPACSEMLTAAQDADRMIKVANAPQNIIYNIIIKNMFKSADDITTFEASLDKVKNQNESALAALIQAMKIVKEDSKEEIDLNHLIAEKVFVNESKRLTEKTEEMEHLIEEYKVRFEAMEQERKQAIATEIEKVKLENGELVSTTNIPNAMRLFGDESSHIKRGHNIFELSNGDWTEVAQIYKPYLFFSYFVEELMTLASSLGIKIYENGILLKEDGEQKLIAISNINQNNHPEFKILSSYPVIPSTFLLDIKNFVNFINECYTSQPKSAKALAGQVTGSNGSCTVDTIVYNDTPITGDSVGENIYHLSLKQELEKDKKLDQFDSITPLISCQDINKALEVSKKIMSAQGKVLQK